MQPPTSSPPEELPPYERRTTATTPIPTAPIYNLNRLDQWASYLIDKAPVAAIAWYVLTEVRSVLLTLVVAQERTTAALAAVQNAIERLPR